MRSSIAGFRLGGDQLERERGVMALGEEAPPSTDSERIASGRWCLEMQAPKAAKGFLSGLKTTNISLLTIRIEALALDRDWKGLDAVIESDGSRVEPVLIASIQGWRSARLNDQNKAVAVLTAAVDVATKGGAQLRGDLLSTVSV